MEIVIDDPRLKPILAKVEAGQRLSYDDGVTLFETSDILAVGYMANLVRERLHGSTHLLQCESPYQPHRCVRGQLPPVRIRQARASDPKAYTMSLEEVWHRAGEGWSEAVTEFHIVGGLHPELTLDWYCEMLRGLKQRFPQVHLKAFTMVEIAYLARRGEDSGARDAGAAARRGHGFAARRRRRDLLRPRPAHHLRSQDYRRPVDRVRN